MRHSRLRRLAVLVAAFAAVVGLAQGWHGWPDLSTHLRDDAFYEFVFAHNLAHGLGPSVSPGTTTSGVQPLWSWLLAAAALGGLPLPATAVVLGILCHLLGAVAVWRTGRGTTAAAVAALLWLGNPLLVRECQNGQETALAALLALLLWTCRRARQPVFVLVAALAVLARADLALLGLLLLLLRRGEPLHRRAAAWLLSLLPWLWFNLACGHGLLPDSAAPMSFLMHENFALQQPDLVATWGKRWWMLRPALLGGPYALSGAAGFAALLFVSLRGRIPGRAARFLPAAVGLAYVLGARDLLVAAVASLLLAVAPRRGVGGPRAPLALAAALAGIVVVHWGLRWYPRDYYAALLAVGGAAGLAALRRQPRLLSACAVVALLQAAVWPVGLEPLAHQRAMQTAGAVLQPLFGPGVRVGSFNSGILAFAQVGVPDGAEVYNLDGVVDARALSALRRAELSAHLDRSGIAVVADFPEQWSMDPRRAHANGMRFDHGRDPAGQLTPLVMVPVLRGDGQDAGVDPLVLCWRQEVGPPPDLPRQQRWLTTPGGRAVLLVPLAAGQRLLGGSAGERRALFTAPFAGLCAVEPPAGQGGALPLFAEGSDEALLPPKPEASLGR